VPASCWRRFPLTFAGTPAASQLRAFLGQTFAKWQLPGAFVFLDAMPRTSVGKFKKIALREQFASWNREL